MKGADRYARRFAAWARKRRDERSKRWRCCVCGLADADLTEHAGKLFCPAHTPDALLPAKEIETA